MEQLLRQIKLLPKAEQQQLLNQLHDHVYQPAYAPQPLTYPTPASGSFGGVPRPCLLSVA